MSEPDSQTHYKVLNVAENATAKEITVAYKALAKKYHPDRNPNNPEAQAMMQAINEAHNILRDPDKRAEYNWDLRRSRGDTASEHSAPPPPGFNTSRPPPPGFKRAASSPPPPRSRPEAEKPANYPSTSNKEFRRFIVQLVIVFALIVAIFVLLLMAPGAQHHH
jgi:curved DNA-binding protein CbpA